MSILVDNGFSLGFTDQRVSNSGGIQHRPLQTTQQQSPYKQPSNKAPINNPAPIQTTQQQHQQKSTSPTLQSLITRNKSIHHCPLLYNSLPGIQWFYRLYSGFPCYIRGTVILQCFTPCPLRKHHAKHHNQTSQTRRLFQAQA
jgi:hypothetical protein